MDDYMKGEIELTRKMFNLEEILEFQLLHDVQIIRSADYQYLCYIDKEAYGTSMTPMLALIIGINQYKNYPHEF
jgi:hypothetical protein